MNLKKVQRLSKSTHTKQNQNLEDSPQQCPNTEKNYHHVTQQFPHLFQPESQFPIIETINNSKTLIGISTISKSVVTQQRITHPVSTIRLQRYRQIHHQKVFVAAKPHSIDPIITQIFRITWRIHNHSRQS